MNERPLNPRILRDPVNFLALGFGSGLMPIAPGTAGTVVAVGLEWLSRIWLPGIQGRAILLIAVIATGIWICGHAADKLGRHDHPAIVWDEFAGYFTAMLLAPPGWPWMLAGFALFRFFDILKPYPIREMDHSIKGGAGIMLDDVAAGLISAVVILIARGLLGDGIG